MKPVIIVSETALRNKENILAQLQGLVSRKDTKGVIEYQPKARKAGEVIRILRENHIMYQISFNTSGN